MVAQRDSIINVAKPLISLILAGEGASTKALELALKLEKMVARGGAYEKQYADHEERVLHRHLNLYRNKLAAAKTDREKVRWTGKVAEQRQKIAIYEQSRSGDLDLDGL